MSKLALWLCAVLVMTPDGRLYVGHSERVMDRAYQSDGLTIYKLDGAAR